MAVDLIPPQPINPRTHSHGPLPYTGSPFLLFIADLNLFVSLTWSIPGVLSPVTQWKGRALDELYPSLPNIYCLLLHAFLLLFQSLFLLSLPFLVVLPLWAAGLYLAAVYAVTASVAFLLNGKVDVLHSTVNLGEDEKKHEEECWIYLNGVSVGSHWLQSNLNRLALTFRRPITGVHNRTYGLIFDLLQCILERDFLYATTDIRRSQGGIEGSLILDWLLTELPHDTLSKLEIYTFGSAANHFNSPPRHNPSQRSAQAVVNGNSNALHITTNGDVSPNTAISAPNSYAVRHIEHYASTGEFVACWGVLYFSRLKNRYAGRVFMRPGTGHLLNQHYLNAMFPLDKDMRVEEDNEFMETRVDILREGGEDNVTEGSVGVLLGDGEGQAESVRRKEMTKKAKVKYFSRLWEYRNGKSPGD